MKKFLVKMEFVLEVDNEDEADKLVRKISFEVMRLAQNDLRSNIEHLPQPPE